MEKKTEALRARFCVAQPIIINFPDGINFPHWYAWLSTRKKPRHTTNEWESKPRILARHIIIYNDDGCSPWHAVHNRYPSARGPSRIPCDFLVTSRPRYDVHGTLYNQSTRRGGDDSLTRCTYLRLSKEYESLRPPVENFIEPSFSSTHVLGDVHARRHARVRNGNTRRLQRLTLDGGGRKTEIRRDRRSAASSVGPFARGAGTGRVTVFVVPGPVRATVQHDDDQPVTRQRQRRRAHDRTIRSRRSWDAATAAVACPFPSGRRRDVYPACVLLLLLLLSARASVCTEQRVRTVNPRAAAGRPGAAAAGGRLYNIAPVTRTDSRPEEGNRLPHERPRRLRRQRAHGTSTTTTTTTSATAATTTTVVSPPCILHARRRE